MSEMIDNLISFSLTWLLIGSVIWALSDPATVYDRALRKFVQRNGRLPHKGAIALATFGLILFWPKLAAALWRRSA